jgi:hypothetical protein
VGKLEGKRPVGRPRHRWEDGIKTDLREIGWDGVEWIHLAEDRDWLCAFGITVMNLCILVPQSYFVTYVFEEKIMPHYILPERRLA